MTGEPSARSLEKASELLVGAVDMHIHPGPSVFARRADDRQAAAEAGQAGMRALVLKSHEGDTVARALNLRTDPALPRALGGVVLNHFVGGLNPDAVEASLRLGGRFVWLPTLSAARHVQFYASQPSPFLGRRFRCDVRPGIRLTRENGNLAETLPDIFDLVSEAGAVLCTGHASAEEVLSVARGFRDSERKGFFVYTHPDISINQAPVSLQKAVADMGGYIEKCTLAGNPNWGGMPVAQFIASAREIGVDRCFFSTDAGGPDRPSSPETLRRFLAQALDAGMTEAEIRTMVVDVPVRISGLQ